MKLSHSTYYASLKDKVERCYENVGRIIPGYSYTSKGSKIADSKIEEYIFALANSETEGNYGYIKITYSLRRMYNLIINKKKVYRLMNKLNLLKTHKRPEYKCLSQRCKERTALSSNTYWQMDMKYVFIGGTRQTAYITSIIDVYDRSIVGFSAELGFTGDLAKKPLISALYERGLKNKIDNNLVLRTDNGSQFISGVFEECCLKKGLLHERIPVRSPNYNAFIESYHRYLQDEFLKGRIFMSLEELRECLEDFVYRYNNCRLHSSIGYVPPNEYYLKNLSVA